jgi:hypothetical protein
MSYQVYRDLDRSNRKSARRAISKGLLSEDPLINEAALEWAEHNLRIYWVWLGIGLVISLLAVATSAGFFGIPIIALAGALSLYSKTRRFKALVNPLGPSS